MPDYVDKDELLAEIRECHRLHRENPDWGPDRYLTRRFVQMIMKMVDTYAMSPKWAGNGSNYIMEMKSLALETIVRKALLFDPESGKSAFSYYTTMIQRAFRRALYTENAQMQRVEKLKVRMNDGAFADPEPANDDYEDEIDEQMAA